MNWSQLFTMQKELDTYIEQNHQLADSNLFNKKILALLVEVGELANETRCFKFWSNKAPSADNVILEEYVDGIHFILSLGIEKSYHYDFVLNEPKVQASDDSTTQFQTVFEKITTFNQDASKVNYIALFESYLALGLLLGFDEKSVQQAYYEKNKVNFDRQDNGY